LTIRWGDTGKAFNGVVKSFTQANTARESLLGSPVSLPTSNPLNAGAQLSFTVQQSDLPTISPSANSINQYCAYVIVGGKNTDSASQTVYSYVYQNGTQKGNTNNVVATNTFWTHCLYYTQSVQVGDVINIALYSTSVNMNYDYYYFIVLPSKVLYTPIKTIMTDITINVASDTAPTLGNPNSSVNSSFYVMNGPSAANSLGISTGNTSLDVAKVFNSASSYGWLRSYYEVNGGTYTSTHASYRPYYRNIMYAKTVSFRELGRW
jgi:hypothetical protein